jgi:hypothetical protein
VAGLVAGYRGEPVVLRYARAGSILAVTLAAMQIVREGMARIPAAITAAIAEEAQERREQHREQLAALDGLRTALAARGMWESAIEGAIRGRCPECRPCPDCRCPPCPACPAPVVVPAEPLPPPPPRAPAPRPPPRKGAAPWER